MLLKKRERNKRRRERILPVSIILSEVLFGSDFARMTFGLL